MRGSWLLALAGAMMIAGCSLTADVVGLVGSETFKGKSTGYGDGRGHMELQSDAGTRCMGDFAFYGARGGSAILSCSDGRQASVQFTSLRTGAGYGFGMTNTGSPVRFYYGMSDTEGAQYIAAQPGQTTGGAAAAHPTKTSSGSGFYVTWQGHLITNAHVVNGCGTLTVQRPGSAAVPATVVKADKQNDLALLKAATSPGAVATLHGGRPIRPGESVVVFGFPLPDMVSSGGVLTTGTVNALAGLGDDTRYLQISAPLQPGNSGGPLMDMSGSVIGVTTAGLGLHSIKMVGTLPQNVNFAIKSEVVQTFLATNGLSAETGGGREMGAADVGDRAHTFTVLVECKG